MDRLKYLGLFVPMVLFCACGPDAVVEIPDDLLPGPILNIRLTDGPIDLDEVNIDLQQIYVKGQNGFEEIPLGTSAGIYNLLDYQNGIDTLVATGVSSGLTVIREIRLVLGENNSVVAQGETYDLKIPSGGESGLKIKVCLDLTGVPVYDLILDFDAAASIHKTGNGKYIMKPVIRIVNPDAQCFGGGTGGGDDDELTLDDLPDNVVDSLETNYAGYDFEVREDELCGGPAVFEIKATGTNETVYLYFDHDGNYIQLAVKIANSLIPDAVLNAITTDYPGYDLLEDTFRITRADGEVRYLVRAINAGETFNITYKEDGTFICQEQ